ncbi:opioid growth factor receptor conserved region-domain-containing protein [Biscogniauxia mediterranea]|nr:opioid growth factor receptor conserved region-domain-containing protein [Biscogniauxia mediterranea]
MAASPVASRPSEPSLRRLVDFYDPQVKGRDARNRTLDEILAWSDARLESQHDYIQTLFPLPEGSMFSFAAPVVDEQTFLYWRGRGGDDLKDGVRRALERMLRFYGFEVRWHPVVTIAAAAEEEEEEEEDRKAGFARWVRPLDHNHLRITRIIRSLRVLGLADEARAFYDALVETHATHGRIGRSSLGYWRRAATEPLHIAPDGEEVEWLEKYHVGE